MTVSSNSHQQENGRFMTVMKDILARPSGRIGLTLVLFHILLALLSPVSYTHLTLPTSDLV